MRYLAVISSALVVFTFSGITVIPDSKIHSFGSPLGQGQGTCETEIDSGFKQAILAEVDGHELQVVVSARFGGAVESLTWNGKEFINIYDHGRQISYAWAMDDYSECLNPTEPGSASDGLGPTSTSRLLEVCTPTQNRLTTRTQPAYWLAPGEVGFCSGGATSAVNEGPLSDFILNKTIQIGYEGLDNVIAFTAGIEIPQDFRTMTLEIPTGYLTHEFSRYYQFNPASEELVEAQSQPLTPPWSFQFTSKLPPILATPNGTHAMGAYTYESILEYGIFSYQVDNPADTTNKWNIVMRQLHADAGIYTYRSFAIVGTLEAVQQTMVALYAMHPSDLNPPEGYVDIMNCTEFAGWAWDPKTPDQPLRVRFYRVEPDGSETLLTETLANVFREDLVPVLGDNGEHGYRIEPMRFLAESLDHIVKVYAVNSDPRLPPRELEGSGIRLSCTVTSNPPTGETATAQGQRDSKSGSPFTICGSAALALTGMLAGWKGIGMKKTG